MYPSTLVYRLILVTLVLITNSVWAEEFATKTLNNLVKELVNFNFSASPEENYLDKPYKAFSFEREKEGWIYISIDAVLTKGDRVWITLADNLSEKPILGIDGTTQTDKPAETMRFVKAGSYKVRVWSKGRPRLNNVVVRSIPEIIFYDITFLQRYRPYDFARIYHWDYLNKYILDNYNVIASNSDDKYAPYIDQWHQRGRKWLAVAGISWGPTVSDVYEKWGKLMENPLYDGIIIDEFGGSDKFAAAYPLWGKTMKKIRNSPQCRDKMLYGFTGSGYSLRRKALFDILLDAGYKCVPEAYYVEMPTEDKAEEYLKRWLTDNFMKWRKNYPGVENHMVICLSPDNVPPRCCWNTCPNVNFKVFVDKQFYHLVNNPAFRNVYGVTFFTAHYMDEEMLRWFTKLIRHYLIEGNRQMYGTDPYILTHLENAGFEQGEKGWDFSVASSGSIKVIDAAEMQFKRAYSWDAIPQGKKVLYTKRTAYKPNTISQKIKNLTPGRLYSLKVYNCDFRHFKQKKKNPVSIQLKNVELLKEKSRDDVFTHMFPMTIDPQQKTKVCWNSHYRVFRAKNKEAELILSDWESGTMAAGPDEQEIIWDFIELEPYFGAEEHLEN